MDLIEYLSVTTVMGAKLSEMIFLYGIIFALGILCTGVIHGVRWLSGLSYILAIADIAFYMVYYDLDIYRISQNNVHPARVYMIGSLAVTVLINILCIGAIAVILMVLRRFRKDRRYLL